MKKKKRERSIRPEVCRAGFSQSGGHLPLLHAPKTIQHNLGLVMVGNETGQ
jgi:hypothetical protein